MDGVRISSGRSRTTQSAGSTARRTRSALDQRRSNRQQGTEHGPSEQEMRRYHNPRQQPAGQPHQPAQQPRRHGRSRHRTRRDPLNIAALILFALATLLAVTSVGLPYWLTSSTGGYLYVGLLRTCLEVTGREPVCYTPDSVSPEWILTFLFIVVGIGGLCVAVVACAMTLVRGSVEYMNIVRLAGVVAIVFFNLAQILFPSAFGQDQIGGSAFQLPQNFKTYLSFVMFFLSHWATVAAELCAAQVCRPRWQL